MTNGYQLKITVKGSQPPIWRRVIVPQFITFDDLDAIIEELFGWTHSHLFEFYITKFGERFTGGTLGEEDDTDECIDAWIEEGDTFVYTYDFGDNWEHSIKVEKIVAYQHRYPTVLKYKGANMIEDCGGIWGYEDCKDEAEPFDMEKVNKIFQSWELPIAELSDDEFLDDEIEEFLDIFEDGWEENFEELIKQRHDMEEECRTYLCDIEQLAQVFDKYTKNDLLDMAEVLNLKGYKKYKKGELIEFLLKTLFDMEQMQMTLKKSNEEEIQLFETAIEEKGICISQESVQESLLLSCYGALVEGVNFYRVPLDVQEQYKKVMTPEFRKSLEDEAEFKTICDAVIYLYGVISLSKFTEIYNHYAQTSLSESEVIKKLRLHTKEDEDVIILGDYFMHEMLEEFDVYKNLLETQKGTEHYLPQEKEEFMNYGLYYCQEPDENTEFFLEYLAEIMQCSKARAMLFFYSIQEMIRMNQYDEGLMEELLENLTSQKAAKTLEKNINRFANLIRKWDFCGHTFNEINQQNKIIEFPKKSKIYPNDPCPCGSGKKYKHCCSKK